MSDLMLWCGKARTATTTMNTGQWWYGSIVKLLGLYHDELNTVGASHHHNVLGESVSHPLNVKSRQVLSDLINVDGHPSLCKRE